jgi:hypothetical protein
VPRGTLHATAGLFSIGMSTNYLYLGFRGVAWERSQVQTVRWQLLHSGFGIGIGEMADAGLIERRRYRADHVEVGRKAALCLNDLAQGTGSARRPQAGIWHSCHDVRAYFFASLPLDEAENTRAA